MKKLLILSTFLASTLAYAMSDVHIVPFEYEKHYKPVANMLQSSMGLRLTNRAPEKIAVLIKKHPTSSLEYPDTVLGFITHKDRGSLREIGLLVVDEKFHRNGYGTILVQHVENQVIQSNIPTTIFLAPLATPAALAFYANLGYRSIIDPLDEGFSAPDLFLGKNIN